MIWSLLLERGDERFLVCIKDAPDTNVAIAKAKELVRDAELPDDDEDNVDDIPYVLTYEFATH